MRPDYNIANTNGNGILATLQLPAQALIDIGDVLTKDTGSSNAEDVRNINTCNGHRTSTKKRKSSFALSAKSLYLTRIVEKENG